MVLPYEQAVDIGYGRGRLANDPAWSLARVDHALGRPADINEGWRSPEQADANYRAYQRYLAGGPWAPIALPASQSVHCVGYAVDTDDTAGWQMGVWNDHGWFWTVYRNGQLAERWHLEYFRDRDNHRYDRGYAPGEEFELNSTQANQLQFLYDATLNGGPSMADGGRSINQTLADIASQARAVVHRDDTQNPWIQELADVKTLQLQQATALKAISDKLDRLAAPKA